MATPSVGFIGGLGIGEILVIGVVALLVFGRNLPDVARSIGKGVAEFRRGFTGVERDMRESTGYTPLPAPTPAPLDAQPVLPPPTDPAPPHPNPIPSSTSPE